MKSVIKNKRLLLVIIAICYVGLVTIVLPYSFFPALAVALLTPLNIFLVWIVTTDTLMPKFLNRSKIGYYIIGSIVLVILVNLLIYFLLKFVSMSFIVEIDVFSLRQSNTLISIITSAFCIVLFFRDKEKEAIIEQKIMEMNVLKSQINSHFLFNALNNIYSMTFFNSQEASKYVMKLSQMLRYVLEDCNSELVLLIKEIQYIENFIDFQNSKNENHNQNVVFNHNISQHEDLFVPPMIFQPIVENCFKYCALNSNNDFIQIKLEHTENILTFIAVNTKSIPSSRGESSRKTHIGLENLRKRLSIYYDNCYELKIVENEEIYNIQLIIKLAKKTEYESINS